MRQVMIAVKTGTVTDPEGRRRIVRKGVTTAHEGHELVDTHPHLWAPISVDYPVDESEAVEVTTLEDPDPVFMPVEPAPADVRAWAKDQGIEVPARGKLPADLVDRYRAAHTDD